MIEVFIQSLYQMGEEVMVSVISVLFFVVVNWLLFRNRYRKMFSRFSIRYVIFRLICIVFRVLMVEQGKFFMLVVFILLIFVYWSFDFFFILFQELVQGFYDYEYKD